MKRLHLLLVGGVIGLTIACASSDPVPPGQESVRAKDSAEVGASATLLAIEAESSPSARLVLRTQGAPAYTSYSPDAGMFVVDLPRAAKHEMFALTGGLPEGVSSVTADSAVELGSPLVRVAIHHVPGMSARSSVVDGGIAIEFTGGSALSSDALADGSEPVELAEIEPPVIEDVPIIAEAEVPALDQPVAQPAAVLDGPMASTLSGVHATGSGKALTVSLEADGRVDYSSFRLTGPERIVLDLPGIHNGVDRKAFPLGDPYVKSIRVAQFSTSPEQVTRVVLDLDEPVEYSVEKTANGLTIRFDGTQAPVTVAEAQDTAAPAPAVEAEHVVEVVEPAPEPVAIAETRTVKIAGGEATITESGETRHVVHSPSPQSAPARPATTNLNTSPSTTPTEDVFIEPIQQRAGAALQGTLAAGSSRTLSPGQKVYTGEPIDLSLKEADIKDVLRLFAQLTGLNIAIDPGVGGTVTVDFQGVPWDQALELMLRQNGLTYEIEGNVMRVGTLARLAAEQAQQRKLEEDKRLNVALTTVSHKLSYAKAQQVSTLLSAMASPRGKIIVDARTNQLIITEIPQFLQTMLNLIETIDIPTPQVVIEARIVETTKNFSQAFGVEWGFQGTADPSTGTGTGLQFPATVNAIGGPFNFGAGNPVIDLTMGNILGTFNLDFLLTAAESEGLVRVVSAPRVTTQDNEEASIESGVQIPIQTRVNFTTTVTYVNATLKLQVTPQITAQDTVILEINVDKTEPAVGLSVVGGANAPLLTRRANTKLMVRDGGTTVIGGIYQASDNRSQTRMPFVHNIPVIGLLFKNKTFDSRHDELLIFITPRIVRNS